MQELCTIGLDLAKNVFQLHGVDADGNVALRKKLRRGAVLGFLRSLPPCLVGMEACATAHYWARAIQLLGHEVRLMPPSYVKAYVSYGDGLVRQCPRPQRVSVRSPVRSLPRPGAPPELLWR